MSELLRLTDAEVRRSGQALLHVDSLVIDEGERIAILGPNGSGKSTLIKLLTREMMPLWREEPPVRFRGEERALIRTINETIGVVSTSMQTRLMVNRPVLETVVGAFYGWGGVPHTVQAPAWQVERAQEALAELGIADLAERSMLTLSCGQARRVMVARALMTAPQALVFDEPCAGLDPEAVWHLRQTLSRLCQAGRTLLLVTHDVADIVPEISRVICIKDGRVWADGAKADILTEANMRSLFNCPLTLSATGDHYSLF